MKLRKALALLLGLLLVWTPLAALAEGEDTDEPVSIDIDENTPAEQRTQERNVGNVTAAEKGHYIPAVKVSVNAHGSATLRTEDISITNTGVVVGSVGVRVDVAAAGAQATVETRDITAFARDMASCGIEADAANGGIATVTAETVTANSGWIGGTGIDVYAKDGGVAAVNITAETGIQASSTGAQLGAEGEAARVQVDVAGNIAALQDNGTSATGAGVYATQGGEAELHCGGDLSVQAVRAGGVVAQCWKGQATVSMEGNLLAMGQANDSFNTNVTAMDIWVMDGVVEADVGGFVSVTAEQNEYRPGSSTGVKVTAIEADQDAIAMVNVQGDVCAYGAGIGGNAVALQVETQGEAGVTVVSGGDLYGETTGLSVSTDGLADSIDVLVNGTVSGKDQAVRLFGAGTEDAVNLTVWALEGEIVGENGGDAEAFAKKIQYILKADPIPGGDVVLDGATSYQGYDVATAGTTVTVLPSLAEGFTLLGVSNGGTALAKDGAGNFFLVVPQGGGVYLTFDVEGAVAGYPPIPVRCLGKVTSDDAALKFYDCGTFEIIRNGQGTVGFYGFEDGHLALRCVSPVTLAENADGSATLTLGDLAFAVESSVIENLK